jgi:mono/diheme cytochrome c family protein
MRAGLLAGLAMTAGAAGCAVLTGTDPGVTRSGASYYTEYCAACHGAGGKGDGPSAAGLSARPADLTRLSAANGGRFPLVRVMAKVYGYAEGQGGGGGAMPAFGPLFEGDTVLIETAPGVMTPTPAPLVAVAEYVRGLQAP